MLSISMSMTMMVPVRPMPALGREGGAIRGPAGVSPGRGSLGIQPQHGGRKKLRLQTDEVTCPGSQGHRRRKLSRFCTRSHHSGPRICRQGQRWLLPEPPCASASGSDASSPLGLLTTLEDLGAPGPSLSCLGPQAPRASPGPLPHAWPE